MAFRDAARTDPGGVAAVFRVADKHGLDHRELAWCIQRESGWRPGVCNSIGACGLMQWVPSTRRKLGLDPLPATIKGQAETIDKFYRALPRVRPGDVYVSMAAPAFLGAADSEIAYDVGSPGWKQNPSLREPNGGPITVGGIRRVGSPSSSFRVPEISELERAAEKVATSFDGAGVLVLLILLAVVKRRK